MITKIVFTVIVVVIGICGMVSAFSNEIDRALLCFVGVLLIGILFRLFEIGDTLDESLTRESKSSASFLLSSREFATFIIRFQLTIQDALALD